MINKRYDTTSALLRYIAGVFALVAFVLLFGKILYNDNGVYLNFADLFFNGSGALNIPHVYGFVAQILIIVAGIFGVLIPILGVFVDNEKVCSFIAAAVLVISGAVILCSGVLYAAIENTTTNSFHLYGTAIAAGSLAVIAGAFNVWAAFIKD